jgi:hypothetical protein
MDIEEPFDIGPGEPLPPERREAIRFFDVFRKAGMPSIILPRLFGVSVPAVYSWRSGRLRPGEDMRKRIRGWTYLIERALNQGLLPYNTEDNIKRYFLTLDKVRKAE